MKTIRISILTVLAGAALSLQAQIPGTQNPPRTEDRFQSNLLVNRIDLEEKINRPMIEGTDPSLYSQTPFPYNKGVVDALLQGLKSGQYLAYDPDNLGKALTWEEVTLKGMRMSDGTDREEENFVVDDDILCAECPEDEVEFDQIPVVDNVADESFSTTALESVLEFIENRIVDKNRSDIVHDIQYIRLVWVDPSETLPDQNFICVKYSDVLPVLEQTLCVNHFNDAETRNMREVFELRQFTSITTNVSGRGVRTLEEAQYRRDQLASFEHNLWSF